MNDQPIYPTYHASPRRDCAIPSIAKVTPAIAWSCGLDPKSAAGGPALLLWNGHVVVDTDAAVTVVTAEGERLWSRRKQDLSPVALLGDRLYLENRDLYLEAVNLQNELVLKRAHLPGVMTDEFRLTLLWPRTDDFVACVAWPGQEPDARNQNPPGPRVSGRRTLYGQRIGVWTSDYEGRETLPPLFLPESGRMLLLVDSVICADVESGLESSFRLPLDQPLDWSADAEGTLCVLGTADGKKAAVGLSLEGQEQWRWTDAPGTDEWVLGQPPIRAIDGRVCALTTERVLALEAGKLLWQHEVEGGEIRHGTALGDGSLLVTAGATLLHLDSAGAEEFSLSAEEPLLTPPVVAADGSIYVATAAHLIKIN